VALMLVGMEELAGAGSDSGGCERSGEGCARIPDDDANPNAITQVMQANQARMEAARRMAAW